MCTLRRLALVALALAHSACGDENKSAADASPPRPDCAGSATVCGGVCTNLQSDNLNCGACREACLAGYACSSGECELTCQDGLAECAGDCVDLLTSRDHCGSCGRPCDDGEICNGAGSCALTCSADLVDCAGRCVDPLADEDYCGAGADCSTEPGSECSASQICQAGECEEVVINPLVNPSFESGDYFGWELDEDGPASSGFFDVFDDAQVHMQGGSVHDYNDGIDGTSECGPLTATAAEGTQVAVHLQDGDETHRMYQDITIPANANRAPGRPGSA